MLRSPVTPAVEAATWLPRETGLRGIGGGGPQETAPPIDGLTTTFDYKPDRDGLALLTGGPTYAGYLADFGSHPDRVWMPRFGDGGSQDVSKGFLDEVHFDADPEYAWSNGFTPFAINEDGDLVLSAKKVSSVSPAFAGGEVPTDASTGSAYQWVSGQLSSAPSFRQRGGYFEIECKPGSVTKAQWPGFWLLTGFSFFLRAEVDVYEQPGILHGTDAYQTNAITSETGSSANSHMVEVGEGLSENFHRYGAYVTDTEIKFYLDGELVHTTDISAQPKFADPAYLRINNAIGTDLPDWVGQPDGTTADPATLIVRRVRVWQREGPNGLDLSALSFPDDTAVNAKIADITSYSYGTSTGHTYSVVTDAENAFTIVGSELRVEQVFTAAANPASDVVIRVTDAQGRTFDRKFTLRRVLGSETGPNLLTSAQALNSGYTLDGVTTPDADTVLETGGAAALHRIYRSTNTAAQTAGNGRLRVDIDPSLGRLKLMLQAFHNFTNRGIAWYDLDTNTVSNVTAGCTAYVLDKAGGIKQLILDFPIQASDTLRPLIGIRSDDGTLTSYAGNTAKGFNIVPGSLFMGKR